MIDQYLFPTNWWIRRLDFSRCIYVRIYIYIYSYNIFTEPHSLKILFCLISCVSDARLLANGSTAFFWKLCCHWLKVWQQNYIRLKSPQLCNQLPNHPIFFKSDPINPLIFLYRPLIWPTSTPPSSQFYTPVYAPDSTSFAAGHLHVERWEAIERTLDTRRVAPSTYDNTQRA